MAEMSYEAWMSQPEGAATDEAAGEAAAASENAAHAAETKQAAEEAAAAGQDAISALIRGDADAASAAAQRFVDGAIPLAKNIALGIVIILVALFVAARVRSVVMKASRKARVDETLSGFFAQVARWAIIVIGLISAIGYMGVPTASFAAVIGGTSLAIGLAFQGSLGNLAAGVMLLIFRPFKVGDVVSAAGVTGKVDSIELFTTVFDTPDNRRIIVPNGAIFGGTIENTTYHGTRRIDINIGTRENADIDRTRTALEGAVHGVKGVLPNPAPQVYLDAIGDSSINWVVRAWVATADFGGVREHLTRAIKMALDGAEIGGPVQQLDVQIAGKVLRD